jgi:hypothetical protein
LLLLGPLFCAPNKSQPVQTHPPPLHTLGNHNKNNHNKKVLERLARDAAQRAALYQESVRDAAELADTTGVELVRR